MSESLEKELTRAILQRVLAARSDVDPTRVARVVAAVLREELGEAAASDSIASSEDASRGVCKNPLRCEWAREGQNRVERAIITTTGRNHPGVMAGITSVVAETGCDILDVSQTIVCEFFTMIIVVDISGLQQRGDTFEGFKQRLLTAAQSLGVEIFCVHEDILNAMHRV